MKIHLVLFCLRLLCLTEYAAHSEMMSTVGDRYTPRAIAETVRRPRASLGARLATIAHALRSFINRVLF
jgi:hypothetical protein